MVGVLQHEEPCFGVSSACRASIGAIPPVWWCPRRGPSSTVHLSQRNSPIWWRSARGFGWCGAQSADHFGELPTDAECPHLATRSPAHQARGGIHAHDETTTYNTGRFAPASRKVVTKPTRFILPSRWLPPPPRPIVPHQQAEKSPQNQHVLSFNPRVLSFHPVNNAVGPRRPSLRGPTVTYRLSARPRAP